MGESSGDGEGEDGAVAGRIDGDKGVVGDDGADDDDVDDDIGDDDKIDGGDEERSQLSLNFLLFPPLSPSPTRIM